MATSWRRKPPVVLPPLPPPVPQGPLAALFAAAGSALLLEWTIGRSALPLGGVGDLGLFAPLMTRWGYAVAPSRGMGCDTAGAQLTDGVPLTPSTFMAPHCRAPPPIPRGLHSSLGEEAVVPARQLCVGRQMPTGAHEHLGRFTSLLPHGGLGRGAAIPARAVNVGRPAPTGAHKAVATLPAGWENHPIGIGRLRFGETAGCRCGVRSARHGGCPGYHIMP